MQSTKTDRSKNRSEADDVEETIKNFRESDIDVRRTMLDIEYLTSIVEGDTVVAAHQPTRNSRLIYHGWLYPQGRVTDDGKRLADVTEKLQSDATFESTVSMVGGIPEYADIVTSVDTADAMAYFNNIQTIESVLLPMSREVAGTDDTEYTSDGDNTYSAHFPNGAFDVEKSTVNVKFKHESTMEAFKSACPDYYSIEHKQDKRFKDNKNPKHLTITV